MPTTFAFARAARLANRTTRTTRFVSSSANPSKRNYNTSAILNNKDNAKFDGEVSKLYNNFFVNGEPVWHKTSALVQKIYSRAPPTSITDIASGPGEPACTLAKAS